MVVHLPDAYHGVEHREIPLIDRLVPHTEDLDDEVVNRQAIIVAASRR